MLWLELRARRLGGYHFTRQFPIEPYFADFACRRARLVVEVDGSQHAENAHDHRRDAFIAAKGYSILRFWSHEVLGQRGSVCETIQAVLDGRLAQDVAAADLRFIHALPPPVTRMSTIRTGANP